MNLVYFLLKNKYITIVDNNGAVSIFRAYHMCIMGRVAWSDHDGLTLQVISENCEYGQLSWYLDDTFKSRVLARPTGS